MAGMQLDPSKLALVQELEIEMMADMYNRMTNVCQKKCIPTKYREGELTKGESVCIDRCVAKYLDIHERIGKKLTAISMQDEEAIKNYSNNNNRILSPFDELCRKPNLIHPKYVSESTRRIRYR